MTEKDATRIARKYYEIPKFEKNCRLSREGNREKKAYRIPGTREHGDHRMLCEQARHFARKLMGS